MTAQNVVSIGASLSHVHVPGRSIPESSDEDLKSDEVEIGMGIHNEAGSEKVKSDLPGTIKTMLAHMLDPQDKDRAFLSVSGSDETVLLVNNLGGVSPLEMGGITNEVINQLGDTWSIKPVRILSGTYMTSLNGLGFSISLLRLVDTGLEGNALLDLLDAPAEATGWSAAISTKTWSSKSGPATQAAVQDVGETAPSNLELDPVFAKKALVSGLEQVIAAEPDITNYDTIVGDGDCGIGLKRGAEAILKQLDRSSRQPSDATLFLDKIIPVVESNMDGTSGALYAIFLNALAHGLRQQSPQSPAPITPQIWASALQSSLDALSKYTPAKPGDRTLIDALYPFVQTLGKTGDVNSAVEAAEAGAKGTKGMKASLGRTVYIGGEGWQGVPDPGAYGLAQFLTGLGEGLK